MSKFMLDDDDGGLDFGDGALFADEADQDEADPHEGKSVEERSTAVLNEAQQAFSDRAKNEAKRMLMACDTEFWFAVSFQTRAQKEQFLKLAKLIELGDKYLDGWEVAKVLGIPLPRDDSQPYNISDKLDQKWIDLTF